MATAAGSSSSSSSSSRSRGPEVVAMRLGLVAFALCVLGGVDAQPTFLGCWANMPAPDNAFEVSIDNSELVALNSIQRCSQECEALGYDIMGLKNANQCWCSNSEAASGNYTLHGASTECTLVCPGNSEQMCGGEEALSIYRLGDTWALQESGVCFNAFEYTSDAEFTSSVSGTVDAVRLVHVSGVVTCRALSQGTNWGCGLDFVEDLAVYITEVPVNSSDVDDRPPVLFPDQSLILAQANSLYDLEPYLATDAELVFDNGEAFTRTVTAGSRFVIWYAEVYDNADFADNSGVSCADVYFRLSPDPCVDPETKCFNGGQCSPIDNEQYGCDCVEPYFGPTCVDDPCTSAPCLNDGECIVTGADSFSCNCAEGFTGEQCESVDQNCGAYGGMTHPHLPSVCCASECGDLCGADNCGDGGSDLCCGSVIEVSGSVCGVGGEHAPCNLQACFTTQGFYRIGWDYNLGRYYQPNGNLTTWEDCNDRCEELEGCTVWTYRDDTHEVNPYSCDLGNFTNEFRVEDHHLSCNAKTCRECSIAVDSVRFSSTGARLLIAFTEDTNRGGALEFDRVSCSSFFVNSTLARFGDDPLCQWEAPNLLVVIFGANARLLWEEASLEDSELRFQTHGDVLPLISGIVDTSSVFTPDDVYLAQFPENPEPPIASLNAPTVIGACTATITFDGRASYGFAGRTPTYIFRSTTCAAYANISQTSSSNEWTVPTDDARIAEGQSCGFELTVENFLGVRSETASATVSRSALAEALRVELVGPQTNTWRRHVPLALGADVTIDGCDAANDNIPQVSYEWSLSSNGEPIPLPEGADLRSQTLVVPELFLNITEYDFSCLVEASGASTMAQYTVSIERSPLEAVISGANNFAIGASSYLQLVADDLSRDVDFPAAELAFEWGCSIESGAAACPRFTSLNITSGVLTVPRRFLPANDTYVFTVVVTSPEGGGLSSAADPVRVSVVQEEIPQVSIIGESLINAADTLRLEGSVVGSNPTAFDYTWSEMSDNGVLRSAPQLTLGVSQRNLVVEPGLLQIGEVYVFQLSATNRSTDLVGIATVQVQVFAGPVISSFTIKPTLHNNSNSDADLEQQSTVSTDGSPRELSVFAFEALAHSGGAVDTRPFRYRFSYVTEDGESFLVSGFSFVNFLEVSLLPGQYTARVEVIDTNGQVSTAHESLLVSDAAEECSLDLWINRLEDSLARGDISLTLQIILELARGVSAVSLQTPFGTGCIASELVSVLERLFAVLETLHDEEAFLLQHAQQLSQALLALTSNPVAVRAKEWKTSVLISSLLISFGEELVDNDFTEAKAVADDCGLILSNLLSADADVYETATEFCSTVFDVQEQLERYFALQLGPLLAGESIDLLDADTLAGGVSRADVTPEGISLSGGSDDLAFTADVQFDETSLGVVSMVVVTLSSASVRACFEDSQGVSPEGPIVIIETDQDISRVEFTLRFEDFGNQSLCQQQIESPDCGFINETTSLWDTSGCRVLERTDLGGGKGTLLCQCDHLTTFAVIKSLRETSDHCIGTALAPRLNDCGIYIFSAMYLFFAFYLIWQIHRGFLLRGVKFDNFRINTAFLALTFLFAMCLSQIAWLVLYWFRLSVVAVAVFISVARVVTFWVCAMMLFIWLSIVTMQMTTPHARKRTRVVAAVCVGLATSVLVAIAIGLAVTPVNSPEFVAVERIGTIVLCMFNVGALLGFAVSGFLLIRKVRSAAKAANASKRNNSIQKIRRLTIIFSIVFFGQTAIAFVSGVFADFYAAYFDMFTMAYVVFDVVVLVTVISICAAIFTAHEDYNSKDPYGSGSGKKTGGRQSAPSLSQSNPPSKTSVVDRDRNMRADASFRGGNSGAGGNHRFSTFDEPSNSPPTSQLSSFHTSEAHLRSSSPSFPAPPLPQVNGHGHRGGAQRSSISTSLQPLRGNVHDYAPITRHYTDGGSGGGGRCADGGNGHFPSGSGGQRFAGRCETPSRTASAPHSPHIDHRAAPASHRPLAIVAPFLHQHHSEPHRPQGRSGAANSPHTNFQSASSPGRGHMHGPFLNSGGGGRCDAISGRCGGGGCGGGCGGCGEGPVGPHPVGQPVSPAGGRVPQHQIAASSFRSVSPFSVETSSPAPTTM